jgi:hypothetical protein
MSPRGENATAASDLGAGTGELGGKMGNRAEVEVVSDKIWRYGRDPVRRM